MKHFQRLTNTNTKGKLTLLVIIIVIFFLIKNYVKYNHYSFLEPTIKLNHSDQKQFNKTSSNEVTNVSVVTDIRQNFVFSFLNIVCKNIKRKPLRVKKPMFISSLLIKSVCKNIKRNFLLRRSQF